MRLTEREILMTLQITDVTWKTCGQEIMDHDTIFNASNGGRFEETGSFGCVFILINSNELVNYGPILYEGISLSFSCERVPSGRIINQKIISANQMALFINNGKNKEEAKKNFITRE
jgi:hypothetical protein